VPGSGDPLMITRCCRRLSQDSVWDVLQKSPEPGLKQLPTTVDAIDQAGEG